MHKKICLLNLPLSIKIDQRVESLPESSKSVQLTRVTRSQHGRPSGPNHSCRPATLPPLKALEGGNRNEEESVNNQASEEEERRVALCVGGNEANRDVEEGQPRTARHWRAALATFAARMRLTYQANIDLLGGRRNRRPTEYARLAGHKEAGDNCKNSDQVDRNCSRQQPRLC